MNVTQLSEFYGLGNIVSRWTSNATERTAILRMNRKRGITAK